MEPRCNAKMHNDIQRTRSPVPITPPCERPGILNTKEIMDIKKHSTILLAWDSTGAVVYCRTFDYDKEKEQAQAVYTFLSQNHPHWVMSEVGHFLAMDKFKPEHL